MVTSRGYGGLRTKRRATGPTEATRAIVDARAGGRCELCGDPITGEYSRHHRMPRRMGGTRLEWVNLPANLLLVCGSGTTGCHHRIESNRAAAYELGWLLRDGETAAEIPVEIHGRGLVYLDDDGMYVDGAP